MKTKANHVKHVLGGPTMLVREQLSDDSVNVVYWSEVKGEFLEDSFPLAELVGLDGEAPIIELD